METGDIFSCTNFLLVVNLSLVLDLVGEFVRQESVGNAIIEQRASARILKEEIADYA